MISLSINVSSRGFFITRKKVEKVVLTNLSLKFECAGKGDQLMGLLVVIALATLIMGVLLFGFAGLILPLVFTVIFVAVSIDFVRQYRSEK